MDTPTTPYIVQCVNARKRGVVVLTDTDLRNRFILQEKQAPDWPLGKWIDAIPLNDPTEIMRFLRLARSQPIVDGMAVEYVLVDPRVLRNNSEWRPIADILLAMVQESGDTPPNTLESDPPA